MAYAIAYDIGTTGVKTCLFSIGKNIELISDAHQGYRLYLVGNGGAEQDEEEWWSAMCATTKRLFADAGVKPAQIEGLSFCSQMQGLVLVDKNGIPVRRPMSYMDQRAVKEIREGMAHGIQAAGANIFKLAKSLMITKAAPTSVKDPVWKYKWVERNEPDNFARVHQWLDVKEYLIHRCTGRFVMTEDSAFATMLYDTRKGKRGWSKTLCGMYGVRMEHLPGIIMTTDKAGGLTQKAAADLGLVPGIPVFGGGGDATLIGIGAGCVEVGDTHVYLGTSGWVSTIVDQQKVDAGRMIAAIVGAQNGRYNYFAEMETAGKCLEWVKDHLALDEIGIYLEKRHVAESQEAVYTNLYDYLMETIKVTEPGAGGVIFTPWLHGNRCPFEDPNAAGIFFNITLDTGKTEMIRAVVEGVCYHLRWMLECQEKKIKTSGAIRFAGGGALSPITGQILADITGRKVDVAANPQNAGAVGAAAVIGVGLGIIPDLETVKEYITAEQIFIPDEKAKAVYDRNFEVFKMLYQSNKACFKTLHSRPVPAASLLRCGRKEEGMDLSGKHYGLKKEMIRSLKFGLFSVSAGIIEMAAFSLLNEMTNWPYWPCYLLALFLSVLWNFTLNRRYTFRSANNIPVAMLKVLGFYCVFTPASTVLGSYLADTLLWNEYLVTLLIMLANFVTEFLYDRFVVFRKTIDTNRLANRHGSSHDVT